MSNTKKGKGVVWKQSGIRKIMRYLEANKGPNSEFLNNQKEKMSELAELLEDDFDTESYDLLKASKVRDKFSHIWRECKLDASEDIREFWKGGTSKIDMQKFKDNFCTSGLDEGSDDEEDAAPVPALKLSKAGKKRPRASSSETDSDIKDQPVPKARSVPNKEQMDKEIMEDILRENCTNAGQLVKDDTVDDESFERFLNIAATLKTTKVEQTQNIQAVDLASDMLALGIAIKSTVEKFLQALGFPEHQPITIDLNLAFSPEIEALFALLMGTTGNDWNETRLLMERALATQTQAQLSLNIFLQSLLGAAVQDWVFHADTSGATVAYLKEVVEPRLPSRAKRLATTFDHQLGQVLPNVRPKSAITDGSAVFRPEIPKATSPIITKQSMYYRDKPIPITSDPRRPIITKKWQVDFLDGLVGVFGMAQRIRVNLAKLDNVQWQFEFPRWMDPYDSAEPSNHRVLMGLLPSIKTEKEKRVQNGDEFIVSIERAILFEGIHHPGVIE